MQVEMADKNHARYLIELFVDFARERGYYFADDTERTILELFPNLGELHRMAFSQRLRLFEALLSHIKPPLSGATHGMAFDEAPPNANNIARAAELVSSDLRARQIAGFTDADMRAISDSCPWC